MSKLQKLVIIISIMASFVAFLDGSVVNVALPAIVRELGGGLVTQQWVVDAYLITLGSLMLVAGSFSDLFGRKRILYAGLVGFGCTSLLCAAAPTASVLIVSRALQGVAGALLVPSSLALIISAFSGKAQGKAIGTWTAWTGISFIIGPLLGGFLVDTFSWRLIFAINLLPIVVTIGLMKRLDMPEQNRDHVKIDWVGVILGVLSLGSLVYGLIEQARYGWASVGVFLPVAVGAVIFLGFIGYEKKAKDPMLPLGLFAVRNFSIGNIVTTSIYAGLSIATFLVVIFVQQVEGYSALLAGMSMLPVTLIMFGLSPRFGNLAGKYGPRLFMAVGPIVAAFGFVYMLRVGHPLRYWTQLFPGVILFGVGLSMTVAPLTSAILGSINARQAGIGSAINNAISRIAGLLAIAAIGSFTATNITLSGFHRGVVVTAILLVIGGVISAIGIKNEQTDQANQ